MEIFQYHPSDEKWLWKYDGKSIEECQYAFLSAQIFDGKTFWDAEQEIVWVDS
ncbi:MAG: hypothetical protein LIO65_07795 [Odoribacter sp.]|nr:hypothetical protein [Odoribacter sp.]